MKENIKNIFFSMKEHVHRERQQTERAKYTGMKVRGLKVAWINKGRGVCKNMSTILY